MSTLPPFSAAAIVALISNPSPGVIAPLAPPTAINWVAEGDSITNGLGSSGVGYRYPDIALSSLPPNYNVTMNDIGTSGITAGTINSSYATRVGAAYVPGAFNVLTLLAGTNDGASTNALATYRNLRSIIRKARLTGYDRVIISTLTSRSVPSGQTVTADNTWDANTLPLNLLIRAGWANDLGCDGLIDYAANAIFATAAATTNATYYLQESVQSLHPVNAGYVVMGQIAAPLVQAAIQAAGVRTVPALAWSTVDISTYFTLSNSNRTIAWTSGGFSSAMARALVGKSIGKWAWEISLDTVSYTNAGLVNSLFDASTNQYTLTNTVNAIGVLAAGTVQYNGTTVATLPALVTGNILQFHADFTAKLLWIRVAGGNWNGSASANPATGVGGIDISAMMALGTVANGGDGKLYPAAGITANGGQVTSRFAVAQMTNPVVAGFRTFG